MSLLTRWRDSTNHTCRRVTADCESAIDAYRVIVAYHATTITLVKFTPPGDESDTSFDAEIGELTDGMLDFEKLLVEVLS